MSATRWLRTSYRLGAVADALAAALMLHGARSGSVLARAGFVPGADYRYAMGMGASLMLGWTALLLWADRRPHERRGVLPVTVLAMCGLAASQVAAVRAGFLRPTPAVAACVLQAGLATLFLWSYAQGGRRAPAHDALDTRRRGGGSVAPLQ